MCYIGKPCVSSICTPVWADIHAFSPRLYRSTSLTPAHPYSEILHALRDDDLFARFVEGDDDAYTVLYARYASRLLGYIHSIVGLSDAGGEDVFQESFLRLYRERQRCCREETDPVRNVGGWLFRVARNLSLNHIRNQRYLTSLAPAVEDRFAVGIEESHADLFGDVHQEEELLQMVNAIVETLPAGLREVFVLREVNGMSYQETAVIMGCSEEAARMRLSRARSAIRRALVDRGFTRVGSDRDE